MERDELREKLKQAEDISTHTLTWSVTLIEKINKSAKKDFNSHAHVERDRKSKGYC